MRSGVWPSATLRALLGPRDRENRSLVEISRFSPGPPPGEGEVLSPSPRKRLPLSGPPVPGPLALPLTARFDGGQDGWGGLPMPSSTAPLAGGCCGCGAGAGGRRGPPSATSRLGRCNRRTGGGSSCPPGRRLDRLSLLPCSQELLGQVLDHVTEEAGLGHRH